MRSQIFPKIFTLMLAPALLAAAALTSNTAKAQTRLDVPFSFTAAGKTCPAGVYALQHDPNGNYVVLSNQKARRSFVWVMSPGPVDPTGNHVALEFDKAGDGLALRSIRYGSMVTARLDGRSAGGERVLASAARGQ